MNRPPPLAIRITPSCCCPCTSPGTEADSRFVSYYGNGSCRQVTFYVQGWTGRLLVSCAWG